MKYLVAKFKIKASEDLMQVCKDLLADSAAEAGFESFEETEEGMEAYVQKELFDKEILDQNIKEFPIEGTEISYEVEEAEDKDWNQEWEDQGFEPITRFSSMTPNIRISTLLHLQTILRLESKLNSPSVQVTTKRHA